MVALLVVLTIVGLILADAVIQKLNDRKPNSAALPNVALAPERLTIARGLFYEPNHTWLGLETSGKVRMGLDDFALKAIGRIDSINFPAPGQKIEKGAPLFVIHQGSRTGTFCAPISGKVLEVNEEISKAPSTLNNDPYRQGWICILNPVNLAQELHQRPVAEESFVWLKSETERFNEFITERPAEPVTLGLVGGDGKHRSGVLELSGLATWDLFFTRFLRQPSPAFQGLRETA